MPLRFASTAPLAVLLVALSALPAAAAPKAADDNLLTLAQRKAYC